MTLVIMATVFLLIINTVCWATSQKMALDKLLQMDLSEEGEDLKRWLCPAHPKSLPTCPEPPPALPGSTDVAVLPQNDILELQRAVFSFRAV